MPPDSAQTTPRKGFTLLELSVGIAIIGALMAVTIPMIIGAKNKSELEKRQANVRTLTDANWRARILGMGGPEITTNAWPDGKPGGCDADIALAFYNRNNLLGKGTEVDLEGLVFSNAIWGTTNDPVEHFNPPADGGGVDGGEVDSSPTPPIGSARESGDEQGGPWDIFKGLPEIDGKKVEDLLDDVNGRVRIWEFEDEDGNEWSSGVGTWDPTTGKSNSGAGRTGDEPEGGWSGGWGSGFVPGGGDGDSPYSGGPTYEQTRCNGQTQVSVRITVLPGGRAGTVLAGGQEPYSIGQVYPMVATPKAGWKFDRWVFEGVLPDGRKVRGTSTYPAAMLPLFDCNITVNAEFSVQTTESSLTFRAGEGGLLDITGSQIVGEQSVPLNLVGVPSHTGISRAGQQWAALPKADAGAGYLFDRWSGSAPYPPELTYSVNSVSGLLSVTGYRPGTAGASFQANFRKPGVTPITDNCQFKAITTDIYTTDDPESGRGGEVGEIVGGGVRYKDANGFYGYIEAFPNTEQGWNFSHWVIEYVDPVTGENSALTSAKTKFSLDSLAACSIVAKAYFRYGAPEPSPSVGWGDASFATVSEPRNTVKFGFYGPGALLYEWGIGYRKGKFVLNTVADPGWKVVGLRATKTSSVDSPTRIIGRLSETQWYVDLAEGHTDFVADAVEDPDAEGYLGRLYLGGRAEGGRNEKISIEVLGRDYTLESDNQWTVDPNISIPIQPGETLTVRVNYRTGGWIKKIESSDGRFIKVQPVAPNTYKIHITATTPYGGGWGGNSTTTGSFYVFFTVGFGGPYINPTPTPGASPECFQRIGIVAGEGGVVFLAHDPGKGLEAPAEGEALMVRTVTPSAPFMGMDTSGGVYTARPSPDPGYRFRGWEPPWKSPGSSSYVAYSIDGDVLTITPPGSTQCPDPERGTFKAVFEPVNSCPDAYTISGAGRADGTYIKHGEVKLWEPAAGYITRPIWVRADGLFRIILAAPYGGNYYRWQLEEKVNGRWGGVNWPNLGMENPRWPGGVGGQNPPECPDLAVGMSPASPEGVPTPTPGPFDDYGFVTIVGRDGAWVAWDVEGDLMPGQEEPANPRTGFVPAGSWTHVYLKSTQKVRLTAHTGTGTTTTIPEDPWSIVQTHNASYISYEPYSVTIAVKPKEEIVVTARGSGGPGSSPSPSPSASASASASASPWGSPSPSPSISPRPSASPSAAASPILYGQVFIRAASGSFPGSTPSGSEFMAIHGGSAFDMGSYRDSQGNMVWQYGLDVNQWTGGRDPAWPLIVKATRAGMKWAKIPGAVYSSDQSVISVPKPAHGTVLYLDLDSGSMASPSPGASASPGTGTGGWEKVRIESRVSEAPWWFEIKDNYTGEIVGIVGGDSPLVIDQPTALMSGNGGWTQFAVARNYPGVVFRETDNPVSVPHRWQFTGGTKVVGTLVMGGGPGASPGASASPGAAVDPYAIGPICVESKGMAAAWKPGKVGDPYSGKAMSDGWVSYRYTGGVGYEGIVPRNGEYLHVRWPYGSEIVEARSATLDGLWSNGNKVSYGQCTVDVLCISEVDTLGMYTTVNGDYIPAVSSRHGSGGVWASESATVSGSVVVMVHSTNPAAAIFRTAKGEYEIRAQSGSSGITLFRNKTLSGKWSAWRADGRWTFPRGREGSCSGASPTPVPSVSPGASVSPNPSASPGGEGRVLFFIDDKEGRNGAEPRSSVPSMCNDFAFVAGEDSCGGAWQGWGHDIGGYLKAYSGGEIFAQQDSMYGGDIFREVPKSAWSGEPDPERAWPLILADQRNGFLGYWSYVIKSDGVMLASGGKISRVAASHSSDGKTLVAAKPKAGETLIIPLVWKRDNPPLDTGEYGWDKLVVKSMVSEAPWYFEVKDNLTGETLGIVGADTPLTLRRPTTAMVTKWGSASGLPIELALARDYPNFRFAEGDGKSVRVAWDWGNETKQVATVVAGAFASPTPPPGTGQNPDTVPTLCVSEAASYAGVDPNGTYQAGTTVSGDRGWINVDKPYFAIRMESGGYTLVYRTGSASYEFYKNSSLTGKWTGAAMGGGSKPDVSTGACGP